MTEANDRAPAGAAASADEAAARLAAHGERIAKMAALSGRGADDVTLIAVSKTRSAAEIRPFLEAGHRDFGENRVQEAGEKWPALRRDYPDVRLHMIGQLQSNKAADAAALFDWIHSVDRPSLVKALAKLDAAPPVFLQVDVGEEEQKGGCTPSGLPALKTRAEESGLVLAGLMCLPPAEREAAPYFALLRKLAEEAGLAGLSMGMSSDYKTAVQLGATHVRIGTALFGARD